MNRVPMYTSEEDDRLVNPTSPLYICVSPPNSGSGVPGGSPLVRSNCNAIYQRFPPTGRSRYHSWNVGSAFTTSNRCGAFPISQNYDRDLSDSLHRPSSLSPTAVADGGFRTNSMSPYSNMDSHPDHLVHRLRYISSVPVSPRMQDSFPGGSRRDLYRFRHSVMDPIAYKNRSLYDNVDPGILHDYADEDDISCFGKFGCGSSKIPTGHHQTKKYFCKGRTLPRYMKEKISPLFRIASRCTSASPATSVPLDDHSRSRSLTRSASPDDLQTLELDLGAAVVYIDVKKGKFVIVLYTRLPLFPAGFSIGS